MRLLRAARGHRKDSKNRRAVCAVRRKGNTAHLLSGGTQKRTSSKEGPEAELLKRKRTFWVENIPERGKNMNSITDQSNAMWLEGKKQQVASQVPDKKES